MTESKHNRTHADQNGNSRFVIRDLLPTGKKNAISSQVLVELVGWFGQRTTTPNSSRTEGRSCYMFLYYRWIFSLGKSQRNSRICKALESRAKNTFIAIQSARRALEIPEGQQDMMIGRKKDGK